LKTLTASVLMALLTLICLSTNAYKGLLGTGIDAGYAMLLTRDVSSPGAVQGGMTRLRVFYGLTDWLAVEASGTVAFYAGYVPGIEVETTDSSGQTVVELQALPEVTHLRGDNLQVGLIYTFDIMRLLPYGAVGIGSNRMSWLAGANPFRAYDVTLRVALGLEWMATSFFWPGIAVETAIPLTDDAPFGSSTNLFFRATYIFRRVSSSPGNKDNDEER
jgi:hypothetical protein